MSEKIELIDAKDLPVTEEEDVTVLCVGADGEMKRRPASSFGTSTGGQVVSEYVKVKSVADIVDGASYMLIYNNSNNNGLGQYSNGNYIVVPKVVLKSNGTTIRMGFDIINTERLLGFFDMEDVERYEFVSDKYDWKLFGNGGQWTVETEEGGIRLSKSELFSIVATIDANSYSEFTITEDDNGFVFFDGTYYLDINNRGLVNGYESSYNTGFILYKKVM